MDWQLRIALLIAGCALVGYIYYDFSKKKKLQKENEKLKKQFDGITDQVDSSGFDHVGVGAPRMAPQEEPTESDEQSIKGTSVTDFVRNQLPEAETKKRAVNTQEHSEQPGNSERTPLEASASEDRSNSHVEPENSIEPEVESENNNAMVLSLILQAPSGHQFKGKDFLPLFLSQGLRHGEMGIFHRRMRSGAKPGPVLFSIANGIAPGTFDINDLESFETPAFAMFITLPGPEDSQVAYNAMYKTCTLLQQELGGDILDETKSVYSKQTHNHRLDQIKEYSFKFGM